MSGRTWTARIHRDAEGSAWLAEVAEEPRVHTYGRTLAAATENIREALALWLEVEAGGEVHPAGLDVTVEVT